MVFNKTDQKLYIPTYGYYFISSQVYFQAHSHNESEYYVYHKIHIQTKCNNKKLILRSYSSFPATPGPVYRRCTTTHTEGLVKMCRGGSISILIPSVVPCCPIGKKQSTHLSVFMIAETVQAAY